MCHSERVESRMTPRLLTWEQGQMVQPPIMKTKSPTVLSRDFAAMTRTSVLLLFSLSRLVDIEDLI